MLIQFCAHNPQAGDRGDIKRQELGEEKSPDHSHAQRASLPAPRTGESDDSPLFEGVTSLDRSGKID